MTRRRPLPNPRQYYTYIWRLDGEVIWVGQGRDNRGRPTCRACWNGRPAALVEVLEVRCHEIEWEVIPSKTKRESEDRERRLIAELKPKYNKAPQKGGWKGMHTEEGRRRIGEATTRQEWSEERRAAQRRRMLGNTLRKRS